MRIARASAVILRFVVPSSGGNRLWKPTTAPPIAAAKRVHALFDLATPTGGPFPIDRFTVAELSSIHWTESWPAKARLRSAAFRVRGHR